MLSMRPLQSRRSSMYKVRSIELWAMGHGTRGNEVDFRCGQCAGETPVYYGAVGEEAPREGLRKEGII